MSEEQARAVIDWKDALLIVLLCTIIFLILNMALNWAEKRWSWEWLAIGGRRGDIGTLLAALGGSWMGFRIADLLGFKPIRRPDKLDSKPPLP